VDKVCGGGGGGSFFPPEGAREGRREWVVEVEVGREAEITWRCL